MSKQNLFRLLTLIALPTLLVVAGFGCAAESVVECVVVAVPVARHASAAAAFLVVSRLAWTVPGRLPEYPFLQTAPSRLKPPPHSCSKP